LIGFSALDTAVTEFAIRNFSRVAFCLVMWHFVLHRGFIQLISLINPQFSSYPAHLAGFSPYWAVYPAISVG
jgi:hypothetical protein